MQGSGAIDRSTPEGKIKYLSLPSEIDARVVSKRLFSEMHKDDDLYEMLHETHKTGADNPLSGAALRESKEAVLFRRIFGDSNSFGGFRRP